ncbi:AraC family transcriptional regulator [Cronbergia sp. UHCC 0137]|uniref:helix-turn-helix transcriptional regulator n=1 Tax=Cronbergia sp. UHCC 0137 TaxID=3110239 RepID=UPI002B1F0EDB|nr:AraC family transcriptional regulator [Cronbergia sp. UHCC 0137]MEA5618335.1 AraC family transcriptional regulator [Cronbergia sp. UHCC 0137]
MSNIISQTEYRQTWQQINQNTHYPEALNTTDFINYCPQHLGRGYHRWVKLRGINLLIVDEEFDDDLYVESDDSQINQDYILEFGFNLSGSYSERNGTQSFFDWFEIELLEERQYFSIGAKQRRLKVDIHLDSQDLLKNFIFDNREKLPTTLINLVEGNSKIDFCETNIIAPEMYLPLEQIINCPFQGITKNLYLEGKCLELIALKLEQLAQHEKHRRKVIVLKKDDIERIHAAKVILIKNINNPPSLIELAHQVGLNDYKLKIGFHQVFGTTVFGYLHQHRMELSRQMLSEGQMSIKEVAHAVGYANHGCFAAAFRKRFGVNPKHYRIKS